MQPIYLDNNATTPMLPAVWEAMRPYVEETFGNPASAHQFGRRARVALEDAREQVAALLHAFPDEVLFTSGSTEANNLALFSLAGDAPAHVICSPIEHPSVAETVRRLAQLGFAVDWLPVENSGLVDPTALTKSLREDTRCVAVQFANHETGVMQPIRALTALLDARTYFHCDAVQAVGKLPVHFHELGATTLSLSAHKFHGPKGIGALLARRGTKLRPLLYGGHQQQGKRPGTEPVALAVGLSKALELSIQQAEARTAHVKRLRENFLKHLEENAGPIVLNSPAEGAPGYGAPHTVNASFPGLQSDTLLMNLDLAGVACSTGSACSSGSLLPSPVLQAMAAPLEALRSAMRFSFSALTTDAEVEEAARRITSVCKRLRAKSAVDD